MTCYLSFLARFLFSEFAQKFLIKTIMFFFCRFLYVATVLPSYIVLIISAIIAANQEKVYAVNFNFSLLFQRPDFQFLLLSAFLSKLTLRKDLQLNFDG